MIWAARPPNQGQITRHLAINIIGVTQLNWNDPEKWGAPFIELGKFYINCHGEKRRKY